MKPVDADLKRRGALAFGRGWPGCRGGVANSYAPNAALSIQQAEIA
jgi:hypothetical protein